MIIFEFLKQMISAYPIIFDHFLNAFLFLYSMKSIYMLKKIEDFI